MFPEPALHPQHPPGGRGEAPPQRDLPDRLAHQVQVGQADQGGQGPEVPRRKDFAEGRQDHLRAHPEAGVGIPSSYFRWVPT